MSFRKTGRNFHPIRGRKLRMTDITADTYIEAVADSLSLICPTPKHAARLASCGLPTAINWFKRKNGPAGVQLVRLMAESDDFLFAILELAGKADVVKRAQALQKIEEAKALLNQVVPG